MSTTTKGGPLTVCALDVIFTFSVRNQSHMSPDKRRSRARNPGWQSLLFLTNTAFLACTESIRPFPCEVIQPMISNKHVIVNYCNQTWTYGLSNPSSVPSVSPPKFSTFHEMSTFQSVAWLAMLKMRVKRRNIRKGLPYDARCFWDMINLIHKDFPTASHIECEHLVLLMSVE